MGSNIISNSRKIFINNSSSSSGGGSVNLVHSGTDITVDNTDPTNPIINFTGTPSAPITVVANYSALPAVGTVNGKFYWVSASQGTKWLPGALGGTYYSAGMYYSNGVTWEFLDVPYQATQATVDTGTNTDQFVTPATLKNWTSPTFVPYTGASATVDLGTHIVLVGNGLVSAPSIGISSAPTSGFWKNATYGALNWGSGGVFGGLFEASGLYIKSTGILSFLSSDAESASGDAILRRVGSQIIGMGSANNSTAQTFRIFGDNLNNKYLNLTHDGTDGIISVNSGLLKLQGASGSIIIGGTGTADTLTFRTTSNSGGATGADFIWQSGNNGATELMRLTNAGTLTVLGGGLILKGQTTGATSLAYVAVQDSAGTAIGYFGDASGGDSDMYFGATNNLQFFIGGTSRAVFGSTGLITWANSWHILSAGTATAGRAPLKFTSGTNLTTAEAGAMEYNGTNLFFTRTGTTRENVLIAVDGATAPTTTATPTFTSYYGGNTNALGDPNRWISVNIAGTVYKIALYT